jgi:hypothetical protein
MTPDNRTAALEAVVEEILHRLAVLERRMDHQASNEEIHRRNMREMKEGMEALEEQTPVNSASREVMWERIEALEGAPTEEMPPMMADIYRRLAALEEHVRWTRDRP